MSDTTPSRRREPFTALWPWPGNIFLLLFAIWAFYMGKIATVADVKSAFYGLGAVTVVTLLLGLRTIGRRPRPARADTASDRRGESARRRSAIPAGDAGGTALAPREAERANLRSMYPVAAPDMRRDDAQEAILELEAALNRDRAERGAQLVKLEQAVATLSARLDRVASGGAGAGEGPFAERVAALEARLKADRPDRAEMAQLVARLGALEKRGGAEPSDLNAYLKIQAFNNAVSERLIPRVQQMIAIALKDRATVGAGAAAGAGEAGVGVGAEELASLKSARELDHRELMELKATVAAQAEPVGGGIKRRLSAMEAAVERAAGTERTLAELRDGLAAQLRDGLAALGRDVAAAEAGWREALRRLDALGTRAPDTPESPADVAALRDALTTIIEQNRDIRAKQELLSAKFEAPTRVELDADRG